MEWQRLSGIEISEQTPEKNAAFQKKKLASIVVLKSHRTQIYGTEIVENPLGTPAMATGGTGDTLAGIITSFWHNLIEPKKRSTQRFISTV